VLRLYEAERGTARGGHGLVYPEPIEEYHAPTDLAEVLALLARLGSSAKLLAGGQSLMQQMKARLLAPRILVDLNRVRGFDQITEEDGALEIGALVRFHRAADDQHLRERFTALAEAAAAIGDRQVRNRGTLVGSIAFAANYGDIAPAAAALAAKVVVAGGGGGRTREQPIEDFVRGVGELDLAATEIVTALRVPVPRAGSGSAYVKHGRVYQDRATIGVAAWAAVDSAGRCADVRIAIGGLARPIERAAAAEEALRGRVCDAPRLAEAGEVAAISLPTQSDELASAEYRAQLLRVQVPKALEIALGRAAR
jgi:aerobic carbon-monoxide dehydrogenase medium subunit